MVYVGDVGPALSKLFPDADAEGGSLGGWMQGAMVGEAEDAIAQRVPDDPSSASLESLGVVEDGDRLRQQAQAVAALAEAFDEAAEPSSPRPPDPEP